MGYYILIGFGKKKRPQGLAEVLKIQDLNNNNRLKKNPAQLISRINIIKVDHCVLNIPVAQRNLHKLDISGPQIKLHCKSVTKRVKIFWKRSPIKPNLI